MMSNAKTSLRPVGELVRLSVNKTKLNGTEKYRQGLTGSLEEDSNQSHNYVSSHSTNKDEKK